MLCHSNLIYKNEPYIRSGLIKLWLKSKECFHKMLHAAFCKDLRTWGECLVLVLASSCLELDLGIVEVIGNRLFSYSPKQTGLCYIFIHSYTKGSSEWRSSLYHCCSHSKSLRKCIKITFGSDSFSKQLKGPLDENANRVVEF